jgi:hypothetical protein
MTPKQKAQEKALDIVCDFMINGNPPMPGVSDQDQRRLVDAIEAALLEAAKVEWPTQKEIDDQAVMTSVFHESLPDKSIPAHTLIAFKLGVQWLKSRLKNVEE